MISGCCTLDLNYRNHPYGGRALLAQVRTATVWIPPTSVGGFTDATKRERLANAKAHGSSFVQKSAEARS